MKPTLIIMAAGMGSRFGGPKQITPVDDHGHVILDYSVFDAVRAGFGRVICVIKKENEADFRAAVGDRIAAHIPVDYAYQSLDDIPEGFTVPEGRVKPWGTGHAVRSCRHLLHGESFAVINADDFYGRGAFVALYGFLSADGAENEHCLVSYKLKNTLTENGTVARGVCDVSDSGQLLKVTELTKIQGPASAPSHTLDGEHWLPLEPDTPVSLNTWGFRAGFMDEVDRQFTAFMKNTLPADPSKAEYFLPYILNTCLKNGSATAKVVPTDETWHGVTYREDLASVKAALAQLTADGIYPAGLWN